MNYKSPITVIQDKMSVEFDNGILKAITKVDIDVNKDELVKALEYDRNQYQNGYEDAKEIYEKALDKACEVLSEFAVMKEVVINNDGTQDSYLYSQKSNEEWKKWCLRDDD